MKCKEKLEKLTELVEIQARLARGMEHALALSTNDQSRQEMWGNRGMANAYENILEALKGNWVFLKS